MRSSSSSLCRSLSVVRSGDRSGTAGVLASFTATCAFVLTAVGCPAAAPVEESPVEVALPSVLGPVAATDLDGRPDVRHYRIVAAEQGLRFAADVDTLGYAYNGTSPGPLLQARVGDTLTIDVENRLNEATTIHWHGLRIPSDQDGVAHTDVERIEPGASHTYSFVVHDAGTFWYHPHLQTAEQVEAGLYGMLVVHERDEDLPDVDAERAFLFDDIKLDATGQIAPHLEAGPDVMHGRFGNTLLVNGSDVVQHVALGAGRVERWRVLNAANGSSQVLRFRGLRVRQIGADGGLWPQEDCSDVDEVTVPIGGRAELEVRLADGATEAAVDNIQLALDNNDNVVEVPYTQLVVDVDPSLAVATPRAGHFANPPRFEVDDAGATVKRIEISGFNDNGTIRFTLNGLSFPEHEDWSVAQHTPTILEVVNKLGMPHPFHLHGNFFRVLSHSTRGTPVEKGARDVVLVAGQETVRVVTDFSNAGLWMYHCHILEHEGHGMMGMVEVTSVEASSVDDTHPGH